MTQESLQILECQNCRRRGTEADFIPALNVERRHSMGDVYSDLECTDCGALAYPVCRCTVPWAHNEIQFLRLLSEIQLTQPLDLPSLAESMDLSTARVEELFDRAQDAYRKHLNTMSISKNKTGEL